MPPELDLFGAIRCSVTAPAGCGKTQLIADCLALHESNSPVLVLTHTNAGVAALRERLRRIGIASSKYKVATIDGWAMRLISAFPLRSGHDPRILEIGDPRNDYPAIRAAAARLLEADHITVALRASYSRVIVDEYQDCNLTQHAIVDALARVLPTAILGDPLQAIFSFGGNQLVHWQNDVEARFPRIGSLSTPWRWRNSGADALGEWLLHARRGLEGGHSIDLREAPPEVLWIRLQLDTADQQRRTAALTQTQAGERTVLIIGESSNVRGRHLFTSQTPGAIAVEAVELRDLVGFAREFDLSSPDALERLVNFATELMTQVSATRLLNRVESIRSGRARTPPTSAECAAVDFVSAPSFDAASYLLDRLEEQPHARVYRPEILRNCRSALRAAAGGRVSFLDAVLHARERNRHLGRLVSGRLVGSTLLLKGLEADVAIITHPEAMDAPNLYVAMTRGARRLIVCSYNPVLTPNR